MKLFPQMFAISRVINKSFYILNRPDSAVFIKVIKLGKI